MAALAPKNFDYLLGGNAKGLSDLALKAHFTLYRGYVQRLNEIREKLVTADRNTVEYSDLKRREPVAYNGMFLHEMYFEALGNGQTVPSEAVKIMLARSFGSVDAWLSDARACLLSTNGWLLTVLDAGTGKLYNNVVSEHDIGLLANMKVVVALDSWEHAYFFDYLTKKSDYIVNLLSGLDWNVIGKRI